MNSEFEAYVEASALERGETHPVGDLTDSPLSRHCESPLLGTLTKSGHCARLRSLPNGEAISYHGLV